MSPQLTTPGGLDSAPYTIPTTDWTLAQWMDAADVGPARQLGAEAYRLAQDGLLHIAVDSEAFDESRWIPQRVHEWRKQGIPRRWMALQVLLILRLFAQRKHSDLFNDRYFGQHAHIFLNSQACRHRWADPDPDERARIQAASPSYEVQREQPDFLTALRWRVQPMPPQKPFGRDDDLDRAFQLLDQRQVLSIEGVGGEGKTALAWYLLQQAISGRRFDNADWITDKREVILRDGEVQPLNPGDTDAVDFLNQLLYSAVDRFGWKYRAAGLLGQDLIAFCADQLRRGRYLLVVDNLETVPNNDLIVRQLQDMVARRGAREQVLSRVLITTREAPPTLNPDLAQLSLQGLTLAATRKFVQHLEAGQAEASQMRDDQVQTLHAVTDGNPLMIQLAVRSHRSRHYDFDQMIDRLRTRTFSYFFGPQIDGLQQRMPLAVDLARLAAHLTGQRGQVDRGTLRKAYEGYMHALNASVAPIEEFNTALTELLRLKILNGYHEDHYSMHALIQAYLTQSTQ